MKVALGVEYFGKNFHGWQVQQSGLRTVQSVVESSLSEVANHPVRVFCSGRTDSGVHAIEQVIHFETDTVRTERAWLFGGNVNLPSDVNFKWVKLASDDFHARFSTVARSYKYKIHHHPVHMVQVFVKIFYEQNLACRFNIRRSASLAVKNR